MLSNSLTFPSANFILIIRFGGLSQTQGELPHSSQIGSGSFGQTQGLLPQILQGCGSGFVVGGSGSNGSPSHSGSLKFR